jgi:hypothetical protein
MIDTDKYEGHTPAPWCYYHSNQFIETEEGIHLFTNCMSINDPAHDANSELVADAPDLLAEVKRLRKAYKIERQIVQAFYDYRDRCCYDHCEAWMLEKGYRVMVDGQSEWKVEVE